ncbi:hemolysin family protein [Paractinoplanes durhamensis]|uniref:Membrane protein n=1 Tax=Paractinoplanes durhamensis TaxID=113563 RepID=A0ABQ3YMJ0_9ACTN|nr:hemolysin family protein [Actinoplanes durhamensis]GID98800.1 membrane protein [Actinoplanes durhamensis]
MLILVGLLLVLLVTAVTGYFVAQEFGYVAADRGRLRRQAADGDRAAARALRVTERLSFVLSGAQLGITVTALLVGYVAEPFLGEGLASLLGVTGIPAAVSMPISVTLALILATIVQMVFGELAPKNLAIARPEAVAKALSKSTLLYLTVFGPVIRLFDTAAARLLRRIGIEPVEELPEGATSEDLSRIIAASRADGVLSGEMSALLDRGLDFRSLTAGSVMVPRVDVRFVDASASAADVVALLDSGHSRFPVRGSSSDEILGVVSISDVITVPPAQRSTVLVADLLSEPLMVPSSLRLPAVLERLRSGRRQMACVVDEFGGFAGVVTFEDIAEELVGPIRGEDDLPEPAPVRQDDGSWLVPARWRLDEISDATGVDLPLSDDYDTVSGLVMARLGRVAKAGDSLTLDDLSVRVESVNRHVPQTVRLSR